MPNTLTCLDTAVAMLARREHAVKELATKLRGKKYPPAEVAETIEKLLKNQMLSDERYAAARVRYRAKTSRWGEAKILQELLAKGVSRFVAQTSLTVAFDGGFGYKESAKVLLKRAQMTQPDANAPRTREHMIAVQKKRDKLLAKLLRRGFTMSDAKTALAEAEAEAVE